MRWSERLLAAFFAYTAALAWILPVSRRLAAVTTILNVTILVALAVLAYADSRRARVVLEVLRDWLALALVLLCYQEMGWFARAHSPVLESIFIRWDRVLLRDWGVHRAVETLGPVLPAVLEIAYALTYALAPFALAMLYTYRRRERTEAFLFPFVLAVLLCYAQFPFWPSEPPRTVFPGQDFPGYLTVFRRFNWWMLAGAGIHTSVFPSAHVAGAFGAAWSIRRTLPERRWVGRLLLGIAVLIATATVYGRYHYAADATAGLAMCALAMVLTRGWGKR